VFLHCTVFSFFPSADYKILQTCVYHLFLPNREEVAGGWRRLHKEELHNLYASPNIIRVIKSRRMEWAGHGRDEKCIQNFGWKT
jgi:hypothetical protein